MIGAVSMCDPNYRPQGSDTWACTQKTRLKTWEKTRPKTITNEW